MEDLNQYFGGFWSPSLPNSQVLPENHHVGHSWSPAALQQANYHRSPLRNTIHSSTLPSRSELGNFDPQVGNTISSFTPIATAPPPSSHNPHRNPSHLDLPNFPLPRPYHDIQNPERVDEDSYFSFGRDLVGSPLQLPNIDPPSSNLLTPVSRPASRISWDSGGTSNSIFPTWSSQNLGGFIDLTADSSPPIMPPTTRKRAASITHNAEFASTSPSNPIKKLKVGERSTNNEQGEIDEVDLRDVDDDDGLANILEKQRIATVKAQQEQADKPVTFSTLQCIICMESMTNVTATHCGHLFCHTCLMEALIAGEQQGSEPGKGTPKCPVCRKKIMRPKDNKPSIQVIPLELKVMSSSKIAKGKAKDHMTV